ncbi:MAG: SRPBCC domain-containing protein [Polyangiaceae bacterium]
MSTKFKAQTQKATFSQECSIHCQIAAPRAAIWRLLTDAAGFKRWNSTVDSIEGDIALGQRLAIKVPLDPSRTFRPTVTRFEENALMEWSDGFAPMFKGVRTFILDEAEDGGTEFTMTERFAGVMLPMIRGSLPDFAPAFESYAADLKRAAEGGDA